MSPYRALARLTARVLVVGLVVLLASCSSSKPRPAPGPGTTVPVAAVRTYAQSICGSLRALHTVSAQIEKFMPSLGFDSVSRTNLKARFEALLRAAAGAAKVGADVLARAHVPEGTSGSEHARGVRAALLLSADDYSRWTASVAGFDTYDRDNWEDELHTFENTDMVDFGHIAWARVVTAVTAGAVGSAVAGAARLAPGCVFVSQG